MKIDDIVFNLIPKGERADPDTFCYYGWEGIGSFAFWRYATAYYDSAEVLFEKFKASAGHNDILDGTGITMCFLYRHFVELSIKSLYARFVLTSEEDYKAFLNKNHNLYELWHSVKPKLSELKKKVGSSVDIGVLEHYIMEFDKFDKDSMAMRYPVKKKDLAPMHESARLDIFNLHDRVNELYLAFEGIASDLDNQLFDEVDEQKTDAFLDKYEELRHRVMWLIDKMKGGTQNKDKAVDTLDFSDLSTTPKDCMIELYRCPDDEVIMYDTLYYTGRAIKSRQLRLPKNPYEAQKDAVKMCVLNMERDHLEFGKPKNSEVTICEKAPSSIYAYVSEAVKVIDWDK